MGNVCDFGGCSTGVVRVVEWVVRRLVGWMRWMWWMRCMWWMWMWCMWYVVDVVDGVDVGWMWWMGWMRRPYVAAGGEVVLAAAREGVDGMGWRWMGVDGEL